MSRAREYRRQTRLMGSAFEFVIVTDSGSGDDLIEECIAEVKRIEMLLTEFSDSSVTSEINRSAGKQEVSVDDEVFAILKRSQNISTLTQGAFDISASLLKKLYNFKGGSFVMPDADRLKSNLSKVGYKKIQLCSNNRIFLAEPGMHIGFGGIGKGYAADCVKKLLVKKGITSGVINASGDLTAWGSRPDGSSWKVGIADPESPSTAMLWIPIKDTSVATSGDYEQYFEINGERYSHTIDPKTGRPVKGVKSVTIVSPSAELSDALATAVFVMGPEVGVHFIEQLPNTHTLIIDSKNSMHTSRHLKFNKHEAISV